MKGRNGQRTSAIASEDALQEAMVR